MDLETVLGSRSEGHKAKGEEQQKFAVEKIVKAGQC